MISFLFWVILTLFVIPRKVFGLFWFWVALPFRKYARNTVYNYCLSKGVFLKRLLERPIEDTELFYVIKPFHGSDGGRIRKRNVTWLEFYFVVFFIWGWLDDDSNYDTWDYGHTAEIIARKTEKLTPQWIIDKLDNDLDYVDFNEIDFGNTFDIGDYSSSRFRFWSTLYWLKRNTAYNFQYLFHTTDKKGWYVKIGSWEFGWKDKGDGSYDYIVGINF